jgi:hypothetical protein
MTGAFRAAVVFAALLVAAAVVPIIAPQDIVLDRAAAPALRPVEVRADTIDRALPGAETAVPSPADDVAIAPPPATFNAAPAPALPLQLPSAPTSGKAETYAVMVGINDYPGSSADLASAVADARDVDAALAGFQVPARNRLVVIDRQADKSGLAAAVSWLVRHAGPEDTAVFFYAGHVRKLSSYTEAIVTADGRETRDSELASMLAPLAAQRTWLVMASCYGGGFTELLAPGRILTAAASSNDYAYENTSFGRSYLVEYMVRRGWIRGGAPDTVEGAFAWAVQQLQQDYPNRVPVEIDQLDGSLLLGRRARASSSPPPSSSPTPTTSPPPDDESPPTTAPRDCSMWVLFCG